MAFTTIPKNFLPWGNNDFQLFDYDHYGVLRTPLTPAHWGFMQDTRVVAIDCEMVGVGPGKRNHLGRVSIVNEYGFCLYDKFVKPLFPVTDYRTKYSGIREKDLMNATPSFVVKSEVCTLLKNRILVGHSLENDLNVLDLYHPIAMRRDTQHYFRKTFGLKQTPGLKALVKHIFNVDIQQGEHCSITDAQATMALYQCYKRFWENVQLAMPLNYYFVQQFCYLSP